VQTCVLNYYCGVCEGCKNPGHKVTQVTKFYRVALNICWSSGWDLLNFTSGWDLFNFTSCWDLLNFTSVVTCLILPQFGTCLILPQVVTCLILLQVGTCLILLLLPPGILRWLLGFENFVDFWYRLRSHQVIFRF
jgi:hypothetical protein